MFCALAALAIPPLLLGRRFPPLQNAPKPLGVALGAGLYDGAGATFIVIGTLLYYMSVGGVWAFMGQVGLERHLPQAIVSNVLGMCLLAGAVGALVPFVLRDRLGRAQPIGVSNLTTLCCLVFLARPGTAVGFALAAGCFMFSWIAFFPYLMGLCSSFDTVGRLAALSLAVQNIGFAAGPPLAGMLVEHAGYHLLLTVAFWGYILAATAVLAATYRAKRLAAADESFGSGRLRSAPER
jgi:MFS family permease